MSLTFLTVAIAVFLAIAIFAAFLWFKSLAISTNKHAEYDSFIESLVKSEVTLENKGAAIEANSKTWFGFWHKVGVTSGIATIEETKKLGWVVIAMMAVGFFIGTFVWPRDIGAGAILMVIIVFACHSGFKLAAAKRLKTLEKQLPNLLSSLRSSLQANMTPQQAILIQADEIDGPLGEELKRMKHDISLNVPLDEALESFADRIPSREVRFLAASIRIAIKSGTDLDPLLETIENIIRQRNKIAQSLSTAVAQVQPALFVSGIIVPAMAVFSFYSSEENREYWVSLTGLLTAAVAGALYGVGLFISKKQVDRVKNL